MSCFYNKTGKAIRDAYYKLLVPAMSYVDLPDELSYYSIRDNVKEIPGAYGVTSDMGFGKIIPASERYLYRHYRSIYHKDTNTIETCIVPSVQEGSEIIVRDGKDVIFTTVKKGIDTTLKLAADRKKPCIYDGLREFPVFTAPGGINKDFGHADDYHVSLFSPPPGTLQLQLTGDETMKGATVVALLYDTGKKAMYTSIVVLDSKGKANAAPNYFTRKTDTGTETLSKFTKGSTCRVYNNFYSESITDWPVQISKEFTF